MTCRHCVGAEAVFDNKTAARELKAYRRKGPQKTTKLLLAELIQAGVNGKSLLDIGGGVGAIQHQLVRAGATHVTGVDASSGYLAIAKAEAKREGYLDQASYHHGDFVDLAPRVEAADIVTLDRVLCCYPDVQSLVPLSAARAKQIYGLVFPREHWLLKGALPLANLYFRLVRNPFRLFLHATQEVEALVQQQGLTRRFRKTAGLWQIIVYERAKS